MMRCSKILLSFAVVLGMLGTPAYSQGKDTPKTMVAREWKGRVPAARADEYYGYLMDAGVKKMRSIPGNLGVQAMRRREGDAVEYTVISYWESRDAIKRFAGEDIEKPHHLPKDPDYLIELPKRVLHYDVAYRDFPANPM
jgi:heme-degrading monooxygenase HmoA